MDAEVEVMNRFARDLYKILELGTAERMRVLCWLEAKVQEMARNTEESKQASPT